MGIALSLLFLTWFLSGIGMIYARGMPSLTPEVRLQRLAAIDFTRVVLTPPAAVARAGARRAAGRLVLLTVMGRPAYRVAARGMTSVVFADTGELLGDVSDADSLAIASRFAGVAPTSLHQVAVLDEPDQWSIGDRRQLPLHKFVVDDAARTELYVSEANADVTLMTTRGSRALAWVAAIPHWLYFRALRVNGALWTRVVLWTSGVGTVSVLLGLILAFTQMRTRYVGWMRWHYVTGAVFGVLTLTWVFSGWLSMDPIEWTGQGSTGARIPQALSGGPATIDRFPAFDAARWRQALAGRTAKEIELKGIQGRPYYVVRGADATPLLMDAESLEVRREPFPLDSILQSVMQGNPGVTVAAAEVLPGYDAYYYDRDREAPLPVLRVKFADPTATWVYVDPMMAEVVGRFTRGQRVERWLYHGFHSLDFSFWYYNKALWEAGMIVLLSGGSILSFVGVVIGVKRLRRVAGRASAFRSS
jgi:hypothetical protein